MRWRSSVGTSAALLGVGLELGLQGGEFCKRRIRIRRFFALAAIESLWTGRSLPIAFARRAIEPLLGFGPAMLALVTFRVWLLGGGTLRAWWRSLGGCCGDGGIGRVRLSRRALLRGLVAARFTALEARTARAFGPPCPARPPDFDHDRFFGGLIRHNVGAGLGYRARWCRRRLGFFGFCRRARRHRIRRRLQRRFQGLLDSGVADFGSALVRRHLAFNSGRRLN